MGGAGEALRPGLRDQEGRPRLLPQRVVAAGFSYRLLIATTDHLGPTARRTLAAQEKPVGMLLRSQLELAAGRLADVARLTLRRREAEAEEAPPTLSGGDPRLR